VEHGFALGPVGGVIETAEGEFQQCGFIKCFGSIGIDGEGAR
jgi:hypothetical protein